MLYYNRIYISKGIDPTKSNRSKGCMNCHYRFFNHGCKFQDSVCNGCHVLAMLSITISDIAIITIKNIDYSSINQRFIVVLNSKSEAINLIESSVLEDNGYM